MGIYDRDYYRREGPSFFDKLFPARSICRWLIGINILFFLLQLVVVSDRDGSPITHYLDLDTEAVAHGEIWRLLSYAFLHDSNSIYHILFNMLFLWWFGSELEEMYGPSEFLSFYLISALAGGIAFTLWGLSMHRPMFCIGASGAVTALLVLYACHFPTRTIMIFFILPVPIWLFAIFNVGQDAFVFVSQRKTQTAVIVHLAGAAFAYAYYRFSWRLASLLIRFRSWRNQRRSRLKIYHPEVEPRRPRETVTVTTPSVPAPEQVEAKLDAVLEKIARTGRDSLNDDELRILQQASEIYKKRRT